MRRRTLYFAAGTAAMAALTLAGCAAPSGGDSGSATLTWWVPNWDEEDAHTLVDQFEEANPDVKVDIVVTTWETMANKIKTALDSGSVPDVITELTSRIPLYANKGQLLDVTDWFDESMPLDDFPAGAIEAASSKDAVFAVPFRWDAGSMIYNKDLFAAAGIDEAPTTWDELRDASAKLAAAGTTAYGWPFGNDANTQVRWLNEYYTQGGTFTEEPDGSVTIDNDASEAALKVLAEGFDEGWVTQSSFESDNTALQNLFINGQIAFYFDGPYAIVPITDAGVNIGTAEWPGPDGPGIVSADGFSFMVPEASTKQDAAKTFVQFLAQPENEAFLTDTFPARISASADEKFSDPLLAPFIAQQNESSKPVPPYSGWSSMTATIYSAVQSVALGQSSAADAAETISQQAANVLKVD